MSIDLKKLTITEAHTRLAQKDWSALELTDAYLSVIEERDPAIHSYLEVFDDARENARRADALIREKGKDIHPLTGIPFSIKDNILIKGHVASCGSKILEKYRAAYDATAVVRLRDEGAVFLGRGNMDEFAMGSSTERSAFGTTKNPHDISRAPGGSSGGPAAAVAMGGALAALGSDTGGSVRQPASFCGIVGLKPTYGSVSRFGLVAMASSLDQIGPFAKTAADARIIFEAISGHDPMDSTSLPNRSGQKAERSEKLTIGIPSFMDEVKVDDDVLKNFEESIAILKKMGHTITTVVLPNVQYSLPVYYIIMPAEASTNLARFDGVRYGLHKEGENLFEDYTKTRGAGFGAEVRRRILLGTYVLSAGYYDAYYTQATMLRRQITADFENVFADVDAILTPTSPTPAFALGERTDDPLRMYSSDVFTVPANIGGLPALSIPSGFVKRGTASLPVGLQFTGAHLDDSLLLDIGEAFERETEYSFIV